MLRLWAFWRRLQYAGGFAFIVIAIFGSIYYFNIPDPTCFDGERNGDERGVDCGGACVRMCLTDITKPTILWSEAFKIRDGQYNAVAYLENRNQNAGVRELAYKFLLSDADGLITERSGVTVLPPGGVYPIFEGRVMTEGRTPTKTELILEPESVWVKAESTRDQFRVERRQITNADTSPELNVALANSSFAEAQDVEVVATIFDARNNPLTASQTYLKYFAPRTTEDIVFTWPAPIAKTIRTCEVPSDIMLILDRSGSMSADGGTPPEPLESAKRAAAAFVGQLRPDDLIGYVSYATTPTQPLEQVLTADKSLAATAITKTTMGTDGVQYTNMGDVFKVALEELTSPRHRASARKVIVFLTDGDVTRPVNPTTGLQDREYAASYARQAAEAAKAADVTIYTIGFGEAFTTSNTEVARDEDLIRSLATSPQHYLRAPSLTELASAYRSIATSICEEGAAVIEIISKTQAGLGVIR